VGGSDLRPVRGAEHAMVARSRQRGILPLSLHQTGQDRSEGLQAVRSSSFPPHIALRMAYSYYAWPRASRLSDTIAQIIYWQVIFGVFNLLNFLCKFVPIGTVPLRLLFGCAIVLQCTDNSLASTQLAVGPPFYFICLCWLNAVYCFDYKWGNQVLRPALFSRH
jgi:hypothetical protein